MLQPVFKQNKFYVGENLNPWFFDIGYYDSETKEYTLTSTQIDEIGFDTDWVKPADIKPKRVNEWYVFDVDLKWKHDNSVGVAKITLNHEQIYLLKNKPK